MGMAEDIVALLKLFRGRVPDPESNAWVLALAENQKKWVEAHNLFDRIRYRMLAADSSKDRVRARQYGFEEICLKCLYNETATEYPFDSDSPYWIFKSAISLSRAVGVPDQAVIDIVAA